MERTYVFNQDGNNGNGGGSKFDIMAMLPNLMGSKGVDPGLLALLNPGTWQPRPMGRLVVVHLDYPFVVLLGRQRLRQPLWQWWRSACRA